MVDREVEVLEHEGDAVLGAEIGDRLRVSRALSHIGPVTVARGYGKSAFAESRAMKVEPGDVQAFADVDRLRAVASNSLAPSSSASRPRM